MNYVILIFLIALDVLMGIPNYINGKVGLAMFQFCAASFILGLLVAMLIYKSKE